MSAKKCLDHSKGCTVNTVGTNNKCMESVTVETAPNRTLKRGAGQLQNYNSIGKRRHVNYSHGAANSASLMFRMLPLDVIGRCISFVASSKCRRALMLTCKDFSKICNFDEMLQLLNIEGDRDTGVGGFILKCDTKESAVTRLLPLVKAGNVAAIHMMGYIRCYCFDDVVRIWDLIDLLRELCSYFEFVLTRTPE